MALPELPSAEPGPHDVTVSYGRDVDGLDLSKGQVLRRKIAPGRYELTIRDVASYVVEDGTRILIRPLPGGQPRDIRVFLFGTVTGALLQQRGILPLHGSVVASRHGAVCLLGHSGTGKSTLAAALRQRGYRIMSDDVAAVRMEADGEALVYPGLHRQKLWRDTLNKLSLDPAEAEHVRIVLDKYSYPLNGDYYDRPLPPYRICCLEIGPCEAARLQATSGADAVRSLLRHVYRGRLLKPLGVHRQHFDTIIATAQKTPVYSLRRPHLTYDLNELVDLLDERFLS